MCGPEGEILVLEEKSSLRVFATTGRWEGGEKGDSPKAQLDNEWHGVLEALRNDSPNNQISYIAKAICIPDLHIPPASSMYQGIPRKELLDADDLANFSHWWAETFHKRNKIPPKVAQAAFLKTFGGELVNVHQFIKETDSLLQRQLSVDYELLDTLVDNKQLLVSGGVGSGKTFMALAQADRMASAGKQVLFLCYNLYLANLLKRVVAKRRQSSGAVCVMAWEELVKELVEGGCEQWVPPDSMDSRANKEIFYSDTLPALLSKIAAVRLAGGGLAQSKRMQIFRLLRLIKQKDWIP